MCCELASLLLADWDRNFVPLLYSACTEHELSWAELSFSRSCLYFFPFCSGAFPFLFVFLCNLPVQLIFSHRICLLARAVNRFSLLSFYESPVEACFKLWVQWIQIKQKISLEHRILSILSMRKKFDSINHLANDLQKTKWLIQLLFYSKMGSYAHRNELCSAQSCETFIKFQMMLKFGGERCRWHITNSVNSILIAFL